MSVLVTVRDHDVPDELKEYTREKGERLHRLQEWFQVSPRTVRRWQRWWQEDFGRSPRMTRFQGLCAEPVKREDLPGSLLLAFRRLSQAGERVLAVLRALLIGPSVQAQ